MTRPAENEFAGYYKKYTDLVPDDVISFMEKQSVEIQQLLESIEESKGTHRYAEGKWTVKELLAHVIDTERTFSYRAMCIARSEKTPLPGMDQDRYVKGADLNSRLIKSYAEEFKYLRRSNIELFNSFSAADLDKMGTASSKQVTARALIFITAGHAEHHMNILREKYLNN